MFFWEKPCTNVVRGFFFMHWNCGYERRHMAILGALLTVISGGILVADICKTVSIEKQTREKAEQEKRNVWVDNKGNYRLIGTNEKCYLYNNQLKSLENGRVIIDYQEQGIRTDNDRAIKKAKAEGKKYCYLWYTEFCSKPEEKKRRYLTELETGRRYYLTNYGRSEKKYLKNYYTEGRGKISTMFDDWEDESVEITEEEYKALGGYVYRADTGVYYN